MKEDYILFCDFGGMSRHGSNVMFGCNFLNERIQHFDWLFVIFEICGLKSLVNPMSDQAFFMDASIKEVFPNTHHRLCMYLAHRRTKTIFLELDFLLRGENQRTILFPRRQLLSGIFVILIMWFKRLYLNRGVISRMIIIFVRTVSLLFHVVK